ncbi:MAG: AAA family ATPase [Chloroflexi bacterium]|jgi:predicted kinase|nr:AAA family ATPase [Chloroflexota bacterium]
MQAVIFTGIQATGKSEFYKRQFFRTHIRLNLDMLRTRRREQILLRACLNAKQRFVVDNTNPTRESRQRYIAAAREVGFEVVGYYFASSVEEALARNAGRPPDEQIPVGGIYATYYKLEVPALDEGYDALFTVRIVEPGEFVVEEGIL